MSLHRKEASILAGLIDQCPDVFPTHIGNLLRNAPESFDDLRHSILAKTIYDMRVDGAAIHLASIRERLESKDLLEKIGGILYLANLAGDPLILSLAELEAADVWEAFQRKRTQSIAAESAQVIQAHPDKAERVMETAARAIKQLKPDSAPRFTIRRPSEIMAMSFDDSDMVLGDRLFALGQSLVIAAAGGTGKSRLLFQLIAACISGEKFLALDTGAPHLKWLILQTENSNRRLKGDIGNVHRWLNGTWNRFDAQVMIHTIENDVDSFVSLENPENVANISEAIEDSKADVICFDPLNEFSAGDLNKDVDMKATLQILTRVSRRTNPMRGILVLHHAITGRSGASKAIGYDRSSFARNSKALHSWARGQINIAPVDANNNDRLVFACGKCSNGKEFHPFAVRLDTESMIYQCDTEVDIADWEAEMSGQKSAEAVTPEKVAELCSGPKTKTELSKLIMNECGCSRATAFRHVYRAKMSRKLHFNKDLETYTAK